jgi:hypothetical protein
LKPLGGSGPGRGNHDKRAVTLTALLETDTDAQAQNISSRSQKLAKPDDETFAKAIAFARIFAMLARR